MNLKSQRVGHACGARVTGVDLSRPVSAADLAAIRQAWLDNLVLVFPGQKRGKPLSSMALEMLLRRMKVEDATVHGFRSAFRDWAAERTNFPREVAEMSLAHSVGDDVERAYRRTDLFQKRRQIIDAWARYCAAPSPAGRDTGS